MFCRRAAHRVDPALENIDAVDVEPFLEIAETTYEREEYAHSI